MSPAEVMAACEARMEARDPSSGGIRPWRGGAKMVAEKLGLELQLTATGLAQLDWSFARIEPLGSGRFTLSDGERDGVPALMLPVFDESDDGPVDVLALDLRPNGDRLVGRRFWRLTGRAVRIRTVQSEEAEAESTTLKLRQDAHLYARRMIVAAAHRKDERAAGEAAANRIMIPVRAALGAADPLAPMRTPGRALDRALFIKARAGALKGEARRAAVAAAVTAWAEAHPADEAAYQTFMAAFRQAHAARTAAEAAHRRLYPAAEPDGTLILDPAAIDWTKRGALAGVETIEILDAEAGGPLGRALVRLNPRIGGKTGVALVGLQQKQQKRRAAA